MPENAALTTEQNKAAIAELRRAIDADYSYRDLRKVDWGKAFAKHARDLEQADTPEKFAKAAAKVLGEAKDIHIWLKIGDETIPTFRRSVKPNISPIGVTKAVPGWRKWNDRVSTGRFDDGVGYILITSWERRQPEALDKAFEALGEFADAKGLIIDVRPNSGGAEPLAQEFAGCFVDKPVVYAKHVYRAADQPGGFGAVRERALKPNKARPRYRGKIAVLMGPANMSSCEAFLLMMKQVPGCQLVGARSYGSSGNPKPTELSNGVTVYLPSWKAMHPDGTCFEGEGLAPDVTVDATRKDLATRDPIIEAALNILRGS